MESLSKLFDQRSQIYNGVYDHNKFNMLLHQEKFIRAKTTEDIIIELGPDASDTITDIGCGMGNVLLNLRGRGIKSGMYGLDLSENMINIANENLRVSGLSEICYQQGSLNAIEKKTDIAISLGVVGYHEDQEQLIAEIAGIVKEGGHLIISTANGDSVLRYIRRTLSGVHSFVTRSVKSNGMKFHPITDKNVEDVFLRNDIRIIRRIYMSFGLGLFSSKLECAVDRLIFKHLSGHRLSRFFSLTVVYVGQRTRKSE